MKKSIEIITEIEADAQDLQRKLLTLPGDDGCNAKQSKILDDAQEGLAFWRRKHLAELKRIFD